MVGVEVAGVHVGFHLAQRPIERFAPRTEMRADRRPARRVGRPLQLELRRGDRPSGRQPNPQLAGLGVASGVPGIQREQCRHRLHRSAVGLEVSPDIDPPRHRHRTIGSRAARELNTAGRLGDSGRLGTGPHLDDHSDSAAAIIRAARLP